MSELYKVGDVVWVMWGVTRYMARIERIPISGYDLYHVEPVDDSGPIDGTKLKWGSEIYPVDIAMELAK